MDEQAIRCGYIAVIGRPNVGKSTLVNRIVGRKFSITSRKPQTTRHRILGIKNSPDSQAIFVDTPGIHLSSRGALNRLMNRAARGALEGVDLVVLVVEALRWTGLDSYIREQVACEKAPLFLAVNKIDRLADRTELLPYLDQVSNEGRFGEIVPISAERGDNVERLLRLAVSQLPVAEAVFSRQIFTDRSPQFIAAEIIREKLTNRLGQEVPYQLTVNVEGYTERARLTCIDATIWVERKGQKAIVIGQKGQGLKAVGAAARRELEALLRRKVLLRLWVKVRKDWSDNEVLLQQLGYGG
jgi:GTP-binding protein Era